MRDLLLNPVFPFFVAAAILVFGLIFWRSGGEHQSIATKLVLRAFGFLGLIVGVGFLAGAVVSQLSLSTVLADPPGKLVDVNGRKMHILCEGPKGARTLVWIPGGYSQGLWSKRNHDDVKGQLRSCIYDHAGTGWSETGPFPRSMETEAFELISLLKAAGETGPFVFAGHSWGGAIATNVAALYPKETAGVILLDPTSPAWQTFFGAGGCQPGDATPITMIGVLFGLGHLDALNPLQSPATVTLRDALGDETWESIVKLELRPSARLATRSSMGHACSNWTSYVATPSALGDTPLLSITQNATQEEQTSWLPPETTAFERENHLRRMVYAERQNLAFTTQAKGLKAPAGAGHYFPLTAPDFTRDAVLNFVAGLP